MCANDAAYGETLEITWRPFANLRTQMCELEGELPPRHEDLTLPTNRANLRSIESVASPIRLLGNGAQIAIDRRNRGR
jgi:hypothetical protein